MRKYIILFFTVTSIYSYSNELFVFGTTNNPIVLPAQKILTIAYERLGYRIEFVELPGKRSFSESNRGRIDGEVGRVAGIENLYPNLIKIPIPIDYFDLRMFSKKYNFYINNKKALENYLIGYRNGFAFAEVYLEGLETEGVENDELNFLKMERGRLDFVLTTENIGKNLIKKHNLKKIKMLEPPIKRVYMYHYLHKKNSHIIAELTKTLLIMEQTGEIEKILLEKYTK